MSLSPGVRLGPYEVTALIGEGGMGKVWRAHHTALNRDDALKVLPDAFASDTERLARFRREAQVLASLNHPNIAHVYGLEQAGNVQALVMELVEGPSLADRIAQGPISVDEALPIAKQTAEALEAAHERGIVHRDLKPANIKLRADGTVKVLDFGLAKAFEPASGASPNMSLSPTITSPAMMTGVGVLLGTAAYMSPEQARGKAVDKRADIWAFGCVLYEMLTGTPPFKGEDVAEVLGAVIHKDIAWDPLPSNTPAAVRMVLSRCLEKDPKDRIRDIGDVRLALRGAFGLESAASPAAVSRANWKLHMAWLAVTVVAAAVGAASVRTFWPRVDSVKPVRFTVPAASGTSFSSGSFEALSPDGRRIAFVVRVDGLDMIAVRDLAAEQARVLPGTDRARLPFWSADSRFIGFFSQGKLKTIDQSGGRLQVLCDAPRGAGGTWNSGGTIVFAPDQNAGLFRVSAAGGAPIPVTKLDAAAKEGSHLWPWFLPDGRHFLFVTVASGTQVSVHIGSIDSPEHSQLLVADSKAVFSDGYLVYMRGGALFAQPFNVDRRAIAGEPLLLVENMYPLSGGNLAGEFSASAGVLSYRTSTAASEASQLAWFDRSGREISRLGERADQTGVELSPDGLRVAISVLDTTRKTRDLWIYDVSKNSRARLTFDGEDDFNPIWSPDGTRIVFTSSRKRHFDLYQKPASGAGPDELLFADDSDKFPWTFSRDGRVVTYWASAGGGGVLQVGDRKASAFPAAAPYNHLSPDGRWIAYEGAAPADVFVVPYPMSGGKWQVSSGGGRRPRWRADGRELFYLSPDNRLMSVTVDGKGAALIVEAPQPLFEVRIRTSGYGRFGSYDYDVSADGQRFLLNVVGDTAVEAVPTVVTDWTATLKK